VTRANVPRQPARGASLHDTHACLCSALRRTGKARTDLGVDVARVQVLQHGLQERWVQFVVIAHVGAGIRCHAFGGTSCTVGNAPHINDAPPTQTPTRERARWQTHLLLLRRRLRIGLLAAWPRPTWPLPRLRLLPQRQRPAEVASAPWTNSSESDECDAW
jgi:hypothetical protein